MEDKKTKDVKPVVASTGTPEARKFPPRKSGGFRGAGGRKKVSEKPKDDFDQRVLDLARVTRVMAGGKRMKFRATMVIGDKKGKVGIGIAKGADVSMAIQKSVAKARKNLIEVPIIEGTVPHEIHISDHSAKIMMRPARSGSGIKAGGVMRVVLELAGIKDVVAKILGTSNKVNNAKATIKALNSFVPQAVAAAKASNKTKQVVLPKKAQAKPEVKKDKESK
ncbi:MAG: 30S ribosomal protein S5 [Patescibacteria group bacterium]|jgi:small subunit ribosomal protein S5